MYSKADRWLLALLVLAVIIILACCASVARGQEIPTAIGQTVVEMVSGPAEPDTFFFYFPPYRQNQPLAPQEGWARFDSLIAASLNYDLLFLGGADSETKVYKNLVTGEAYDALQQRPFNRDFGQARAEVGVERVGRGEAKGILVAKKEQRGLYVVRIPFQAMFIPEAAFPQSIEISNLFEGFPTSSDPLTALIQLSDGNTVSADVQYSIADTAIARIEAGRVRYLKTGQTTLLAEYGMQSDTTQTRLSAGNGTSGHNGHDGKVYLKKTVAVRVLKFPETNAPVLAKEPTGLWAGFHISRVSKDGESSTLTSRREPTFAGADVELQTKGISLLASSDWRNDHPSALTVGAGLPIQFLGVTFTPYAGAQVIEGDPRLAFTGSLRVPVKGRLSFRLAGLLIRGSKEHPAQFYFNQYVADGKLIDEWQHDPAWTERWWDGKINLGFQIQLSDDESKKRGVQ